MSNNAPDYQDNLYFDSEIDKVLNCDIDKLQKKIDKLEKQLKIAKDCLIKVYNAPFNAKFSGNGYYILGQLLAEVNEALRKIEKLNKNKGSF